MNPRDHRTKVNGLWIPLVTPMKDDRVDLDGLKALLDWLIDFGIDGIVVGGTTGEGALLEMDELDELVKCTIEHVCFRCPVIASIPAISTRHGIEAINSLKHHSLSGLMISAPPYIRPTQGNLIKHFETLAKESDLPIMLYNNPLRTGVNLTPSTINMLSDNDQFIAIKQSLSSLHDLEQILQYNKLSVMCGDDSSIKEFIQLGAHGAVSVLGHMFPSFMLKLIREIATGEHLLNSDQRFTLNAGLSYLVNNPNPAAIKKHLSRLGLIQNELRLPLQPMN